jgi:hypothetical protein
VQYNSKPLPNPHPLCTVAKPPQVIAFKILLHANSNPTQNHPNPNPLFIFLAPCSVCLSPNQANNFEKLTLSILKKQDNGLIMKKIGNKWKRRQNQYWRVDFGLYQVSNGAGDGGVFGRVSGNVYSCSHMVTF